jgi:hypothetical protein
MVKQEAVYAEGVSLLTEARRELRRAKHRVAIHDLTEMTHLMRQKCAAAAALEGDGVASVTAEMGLAQFMANTVNTEGVVSTYLNPPPRREANPLELVKFLRSTSYIEGPLDGRLFNEGEGAGFPPAIASMLCASGAATWVLPNAETAKAEERARKELGQRAALAAASEPRVNVEMGAGMAAAANE